MKRTKRLSLKLTLAFAAVLCAFAATLFACAPQQANESQSSDSPQAAVTADTEATEVAPAKTAASADMTGEYVSDEQCLSCHGSYEEVAANTESYGLSNPHDSIHGGYNACVNCPARDKELTDNQCMHCHDWPHNPE